MLKINELARLHLGVKGENLSRTIEIDMSAWASIYPNATAEILHKRQGDQTKALTGATYDADSMILSWAPTEYDTFYEGYGLAEIRMVEGQVVKKTKDLIVTAVCPSIIDGSGQVVASDYQAFLNSVIGYKNEANAAKNAAEDAVGDAEAWAKGTREDVPVDDEDPAYENNAKYYADAAGDAAEAAEAAASHAPYIDNDTGNWMVWNFDTGDYVNTWIHAQGPQGEPGTIENVRATGIKMSMLDETTAYDAIMARASKVTGGTSGNFAGIDSNGDLTDSGSKASDFLTEHQDITGKADKVASATSGNFAGLDSNGNLTDSGSKASDFLTQHQDITGKADKVSGGTENNFAALDANGNLTDSGSKASDFLTEHQDITGKADKVSSATSGNFAGLDANGNLTDSGSKAGDFLTTHQDISGKANADAIAIVSDGNTHAAITAGQYVYVKNHSTLADGLYTASSNIAANGALTSSNVAAVTGGGLNVLNSNLTSLSDQIATYNVGSLANQSAIESALVTLGASMSDMQFMNVRFAFSAVPSSGIFNGKSGYYIGTFKRSTTNIYSIDVQNAGTGTQKGEHITGTYNGTSWTWGDVYDQIKTLIPVITSASANDSGQYINQGDYFIAQGTLYIATANIPQNYSWSDRKTTPQKTNAINSINALEAVSLTVNTTNINANNLFIRKQSNASSVVTINGWVEFKNAPSGSAVEVGTLAAGARPADTVRTMCAFADHAYDAPSNFGYLAIGTGGAINVTGQSGNTKKAMYVSCSFHAQN